MFSEQSKITVNLKRIEDIPYTFNNQHISKASFLRLRIPDILEESYLYLDSDILVRQNWEKILNFNPEFTDFPVSARPEWGECKSRMGLLNEARRLSKERYFNAGVMIVDSKKWRTRYKFSKTCEVIQQYNELGLENSDQCVLNYLTKGSYLTLPGEFNRHYAESEVLKSSIIHFAGSIKPWHKPLRKILWHFILDWIQPRATLSLFRRREGVEAIKQLFRRSYKFHSILLSFLLYQVRFKKFQFSFRNLLP